MAAKSYSFLRQSTTSANASFSRQNAHLKCTLVKAACYKPPCITGPAHIPNASFMDREESIDRANFSPEAVSAESKSAAFGLQVQIRTFIRIH